MFLDKLSLRIFWLETYNLVVIFLFSVYFTIELLNNVIEFYFQGLDFFKTLFSI